MTNEYLLRIIHDEGLLFRNDPEYINWVEGNVLLDVSSLILGNEPFNDEDIENLMAPVDVIVPGTYGNTYEDEEPKDINGWWAVSAYLFKYLRALDEPVVEHEPLYLWGRYDLGKFVYNDEVILKAYQMHCQFLLTL